ncbi:MAG: DUF1926 domain-containing protein [Treponema sp.]|jgi:hypothetical protein|nr:DUF1926 domain-containing protein [Treponema sp.]
MTIQFILGSHYHIPLSAGDSAFEAVYRSELKPFISTLYKYPKIQTALHYSGVLLQWLERFHPEFFMLIGDLVSRKQVELLGGGFYEPMMPLLPLSDRIGQIELLTTYLRKQFGKRPQGCMLPLMAWEPQLVGPLNACGMRYTFLDEKQFRQSGLSDHAFAPSITEDQGKIITIFPILSCLGAAFAQQRASEVIEYALQNHIHRDNPGKEQVMCVFPKRFFIENPDTEAAEFTFHRFFEDLSAFESQIEFTLPNKVFKTTRHLKKAYFPCSLQKEIFPDHAFTRQTSLPRQFLIMYPEANSLYAKMMFTHVLINQFRGDKSRKRTAREELWKAQGYDSFCPTRDGGIPCHSVRKAAYRALLEAEKITREMGDFMPSLVHFDFDLDGEGEYLFQGEHINCYIKLEGASVFEFDYLPRSWNYLDTFNQGFRRTAFTDRLVSPEAAFQDLLDSPLIYGRHCGKEQFELVRMDKDHSRVYFRLPVKPAIPYGNIELEKSYHLKKDVLVVNYSLYNRGPVSETFQFIPSIDLSFHSDEELFLRVLESPAGDITFQDLKNETALTLASDQIFQHWIRPIYSPYAVNGVWKELYQSTCIMFSTVLSLDSNEGFQTEFRLTLEKNEE